MRRRHLAIGILLLGLAAAGARSEAPPATAAAPSYPDEIRPLFQAKCVRCHGGKACRADLDLTTPAGALKGGQSGKVIVPGKPEESLLFNKLQSGKMPPAMKDPLTDGELDAVRRWIAAGAKF